MVGLGGSLINIKKDGDVADSMRINSFKIKKRFVRRGNEEKSSLLEEQEDCWKRERGAYSFILKKNLY